MRNADFRFFFPSAGTLFVTLSPKSNRINYGISHNIYRLSIGTQIVTPLGISQHFRPQPLGILFVASNPSAIVWLPQKDHFGIAFNSAVLLDISLDII